MNCTKSTPRKTSEKLKSQSTTPPLSTMKSSPFKMTAYKPATSTNIASPPRTFEVDTVTSSFVDGGGKGLFIGMLPSYLESQQSKLCYTPQENQLFEQLSNVDAAADTGQKPDFFEVFFSTPREAGEKNKSTFSTKSKTLRGTRFVQKVNLFDVSAAGRHLSKLYVFYDLMHSLAAQIKLVSNLAERRTRRAHLQNFRISRRICSRTRLQWSPLPTRNRLDGCRAFVRKLVFSAALPHVSDPSSQSNVGSVNIFYMNRWNIAMSFTCRKLLQGFDVCIEACNVVHRQNTIRDPMGHVDDALFFINPQHLTEVTE